MDVQLISVIEESDFVEYPGNTPADIARATRDAIASREGELAAQRNRTRIAAHDVQVSIRIGCRVDEIVRCAQEHDAALIVMGTGSDGVLARLLHRQTVMRVAAATTVPILAVPADGHALRDPRLWLVALKGVGIVPAESERWRGL